MHSCPNVAIVASRDHRSHKALHIADKETLFPLGAQVSQSHSPFAYRPLHRLHPMALLFLRASHRVLCLPCLKYGKIPAFCHVTHTIP